MFKHLSTFVDVLEKLDNVFPIFFLTTELVRVQIGNIEPLKAFFCFVLFSQRQSGGHPSEELAGLCGDISI